MALLRRKLPPYEGYQFSGDDKSPGWPADFLTATTEYQPDGTDKACMVSGLDYAHIVRKGEWLIRHNRSGEFFTLTDAILRDFYEEVA